MATVKLNPVLASISGAIGGMVFYTRYGKTISREWIIPPNPNTPAQQANRSRFREAMLSWRALPDEEKDSYNHRARKMGMTGHNLFISRYMKPQTAENKENGGFGDGSGPKSARKGMFALSNRVQGNAAPGKNIALSGQSSEEFALRPRFALSKESALSSCFTLSNAPSSLHRAYRSVTAPSPPAHRACDPFFADAAEHIRGTSYFYVAAAEGGLKETIEGLGEGTSASFTAPVNYLMTGDYILTTTAFSRIRDKFGDPAGYIALCREIREMKDFQNRFRITDREAEITALAVSGLSYKDISSNLSISERTVERHLTNIYNKLGINNKIDLYRVAEEYNIKP